MLYNCSTDRRADINTEEFQKLAVEIASHMEGSWTHHIDPDRSYQSIRKGDYRICIHLESYPKDAQIKNPKLRITGDSNCKSHPDFNLYHHVSYSERQGYTSEITVSASRGAKTIAKEIERRFLPGYIKVFDSALASHIANTNDLRRRQNLIKELASIIGGRPHHNREYCSIYHYLNIPDTKKSLSCEVELCSDVTMNLRSLPIDLTQQILQVIANYTAPAFETWQRRVDERIAYRINPDEPDEQKIPLIGFDYKASFEAGDCWDNAARKYMKLFESRKQELIESIAS